jgi:hypothetical protein
VGVPALALVDHPPVRQAEGNEHGARVVGLVADFADEAAVAACEDDARLRVAPGEQDRRHQPLPRLVDGGERTHRRDLRVGRAAEHDDASGSPAALLEGREALFQRRHQHVADR